MGIPSVREDVDKLLVDVTASKVSEIKRSPLGTKPSLGVLGTQLVGDDVHAMVIELLVRPRLDITSPNTPPISATEVID